MLVLSRKPGESITIGDDIVLTIKSISPKSVRITIDAPRAIPILRGELAKYEEPSRHPGRTARVQDYDPALFATGKKTAKT